MELIGPRIQIRYMEPSHAEELLDLLLRNRDFFRPFEPRRPESNLTLEEQTRMLEETTERRLREEEYGFGIFTNDEGKLIGRCNLTQVMRRAFQNAYLGYFLDEAHNGRGLMTEAVGLVVDFAFGPGRLHRVQAAVMTTNPGSQRVLEKAGFRREGFAPNYLSIDGAWRDHHLYAITREDREGAG